MPAAYILFLHTQDPISVRRLQAGPAKQSQQSHPDPQLRQVRNFTRSSASVGTPSQTDALSAVHSHCSKSEPQEKNTETNGPWKLTPQPELMARNDMLHRTPAEQEEKTHLRPLRRDSFSHSSSSMSSEACVQSTVSTAWLSRDHCV